MAQEPFRSPSESTNCPIRDLSDKLRQGARNEFNDDESLRVHGVDDPGPVFYVVRPIPPGRRVTFARKPDQIDVVFGEREDGKSDDYLKLRAEFDEQRRNCSLADDEGPISRADLWGRVRKYLLAGSTDPT